MNVTMPQVVSGEAAAPPSQAGAQRAAAAAAVALPGAQTQAAAPARQPSKEQIERAVENLSRASRANGQNLQFSVDSDSGETVIRVVDSGTREVIRQIPSEEVLQIARELEKMQGLLLRQQA